MVALEVVVLSYALAAVSPPVLVEFHASWCAPCKQMAPVVQQLEAAGYTVQHVDVDQHPQLAAQYRVSEVPCFVLLVDGREVDRVKGTVSRQTLEQMFVRAGAAKADPGQAALQSAQQTAAGALATANQLAQGGVPQPTIPAAGVNIPQPIVPQPMAPNANVNIPRPALPTADSRAAQPIVATEASPTTPAVADAAPSRIERSKQGSVYQPRRREEEGGTVSRLTAASVRLRIDDGNGRSIGSGTIIDARSGEALVVTCGHVFRQSKGKGKIEVDLLAPGAPQGLPARLVGYNLDSDIGLLSIRPGVPVQPARMAGPEFRPARDEPVISLGCDHGGPPTARLTRITSINKFLGPDNLQTAGQPVQGRSGGGLFTGEGMLIGVCNAADPTDNEGLFAAVSSIHAELASLGLDELLSSKMTIPTAVVESNRAPASGGVASGPASAPAASAALATGATPASVAQLAAAYQGAEVVCLVRQPNDPTGQGELIVLDRASPELLARLTAERRQQPARTPVTQPALMTSRPTATPR